MAKNPLLNKQALPGSYADYLTMNKNAAAFDTIIANNEKISASPVPGAPNPYGDYFKPDASADSGTGTGSGSDKSILQQWIDYFNGVGPRPDVSGGTPGNPGTGSGTDTGDKSPYEIWMEQYGQQAQLMPAQSYGDWLAAGGMAGAAQKAYNDAVRAAETDYEKSKAMYGANAEALGRAGLTGSGYGDYLTGAGFSGMQGAKVAAADTKALTEAQQRSDYASYLMGVQQTNAQLQAQADAANRQSYAQYLALGGEARGVIDSMMQSGQDDAAIKAYIQQHYGSQFDSQLDGWITGAHSYNDPIIAETNTAKTEVETEAADAAALERAQAAYSALLAGYQDGAIVNVDTANTELKRAGFTQAEIDKALAEYSESTIQRLRTNMNISGATFADVPTSAYIDDLVTTGQITQTQADAFKSEAQAKRADMLAEMFKNVTSENAGQYMQSISDYYKSGDITKSKFESLMGAVVEANLLGATDEAEPATAAAMMISALRSNPEYKDIVGDLEARIANNMTIVKQMPSIVAGKGIDNVVLDVSFGDNAEGKASTQRLVLNVTNGGSAAAGLGQGSQGEIKEKDGKLYVYDGKKNVWNLLVAPTKRSSGSAENSEILYGMLVKYYSAK